MPPPPVRKSATDPPPPLRDAHPVGPMATRLSQARFLLSCAQLGQLPRDQLPEVAFVGRSNAGKSTAINTLCRRTGLARVSKTPGRTQLINVFDIGPEARLIDLPGYGFAAVPLAVKKNWGKLISGYLDVRHQLKGVVIMMDIRHPFTDLDEDMVTWAVASRRRAHILLTKADKLGHGAMVETLRAAEKHVVERWPGAGVTVQTFSAVRRKGLAEAMDALEDWLKLAPAEAPRETTASA